MVTKLFHSATPVPARRIAQPEGAEDTSEPTDFIEKLDDTDASDDPWPRYSRPDDE